MCDFCGCRDSGPTAELADEHVRLADLSDQLRAALASGGATTGAGGLAEIFHEFVHLLGMHAAKEEVGLFPEAQKLGFLGDQLEDLIREHEQLHAMLADGPHGKDVDPALKLLAQHIDDEEWELFPHVINELDPEQWDEIALAHLAVEAEFSKPTDAR